MNKDVYIKMLHSFITFDGGSTAGGRTPQASARSWSGYDHLRVSDLRNSDEAVSRGVCVRVATMNAWMDSPMHPAGLPLDDVMLESTWNYSL